MQYISHYYDYTKYAIKVPEYIFFNFQFPCCYLMYFSYIFVTYSKYVTKSSHHFFLSLSFTVLETILMHCVYISGHE